MLPMLYENKHRIRWDMRARLYSIPDIHAPKTHLLDPHLLEGTATTEAGQSVFICS